MARAVPDPVPMFRRMLAALLLALAVPGTASAASATGGADAFVLAARDAHARRDLATLADARARALAESHPLAPWVGYWELNARLGQATAVEVEAFYARWSGTYVEDRLRNDWLLELGRRRDWTTFRADHPRFRMNDDREVACYDLLTRHLAGEPVRDAARTAWLAQRDADDGCHLLARTLLAAGVFTSQDAWRKVRLATEQGRAGAARAALGLLDGVPADALDALAVARLAATDPDRAAARLDGGLASRLPGDWTAWAWAQVGRQAAIRLQPQAAMHFRRAEAAALRAGVALPAGDETLAWQVRAALRSTPTDWRSIRVAVDAMSDAERAGEAWIYWSARADLALAPAGVDGEPERDRARRALEVAAGRMSFYGRLAAEQLGRSLELPARPAPLTDAERQEAQRHAGLARALHAIAAGLRSEGVREWNYSLRGMDDRQLLAAAQLACDRAVWDRCINTSERTRTEVDVEQRFPTPYRAAVLGAAAQAGIDPAYVYGLIRQESRFIADARSHVGASGLMQLMPATARWTAKRLGVPYSAAAINDRELNLRLGTGYLKLLLDDFDGSQALAAAGYNAGPGRPRRWREGPVLEAAMWAESIPFTETRDYVQKVLANAVYYGARLSPGGASLQARLGESIGPRLASNPVPDRSLP